MTRATKPVRPARLRTRSLTYVHFKLLLLYSWLHIRVEKGAPDLVIQPNYKEACATWASA